MGPQGDVQIPRIENKVGIAIMFQTYVFMFPDNPQVQLITPPC